MNYISHVTLEDLQSERDEVLNCKEKDIRKLADMIGEAMGQECLCVLGSEKKIKDNKDVFNKLINVFD